MTDIREKVAMAIYDAFPLLDPDGAAKGLKRPRKIEWAEVVEDERSVTLKQADAALLACGYDEMRNALEWFAVFRFDDGSRCWCTNTGQTSSVATASDYHEPKCQTAP